MVRAEAVTVDENEISVELPDGRSISAPLAWYPRLLRGTPEERSNWRLVGQGAGIHWPALDEDISVQNLLAGKASGESQRSLKRWLAQRVPQSSRLYREQEDYDTDVRARTFTWDWSSEYKAIKEGDDQEHAIDAYEKQRNIPVYYLLYHPFRLGWNMSVPIWGPRRRAPYKLGTRIVPSAEIRSACASLTSGKSPSAEMLKQVRKVSYQGNDVLGCRLEDFVADRVLGCQEGYIATNPEDFALEQVFFNRSGPIAAAIAVTVDLPEGD